MCAAVMDTLRRYIGHSQRLGKEPMARGTEEQLRIGHGSWGTSVRWSRTVDRVVEDVDVRPRIGLLLATSSSH
jgi:hypothetical protein